MGLIGSKFKDIYNSRYTTADIQSIDRVWYVPIKFMLGDYFLVNLEGLLYCFKLKENRIKTWRQSLTRSFRKVYFSIDHYLPLSPGDIKDLSDILIKNNLPKVDSKLYKTFKILGDMEKVEFKPHEIDKLITELEKHKNEYKVLITEMTDYLNHLHVDKIITPVKTISEFLESDLKATDPKFLGTVVTTAVMTDIENKKITNTPVTGKKPWLKFIAIIAMIAIVIGIGVLIWQSGMFQHFSLPGLPTFGGPPTTTSITQQYATPEALKAAIDRGDVNYKDLPPDVQKMVDQVKTPEAKPKQ